MRDGRVENVQRLFRLTRLQQVFFPDGIRFDGNKLVGTGTTLPVFNYLNPISDEKKELVDLTGIEPVTS